MNMDNDRTDIVITAIVSGFAHPHCGPWLTPASIIDAPSPRVSEPATSKVTSWSRSVSGSNQSATTTPMMHKGVCTKKMMRQPKASTSGAPATTPRTGAPALTKLQ